MKRRTFFGALAALFGLPWLAKSSAKVVEVNTTQPVVEKRSSDADVTVPMRSYVEFVWEGQRCVALYSPITNQYHIVARECL